MKKEKLIELIDIGIEREKKVVPTYTKHLDTLTDLSLDKEEKERLENLFRKMKKASNGHEEKLEEIKERIEKEDKDEY